MLHIGKSSKLCPEQQVHRTKIERVSDDTYLGDIISEDGKNTKNIKNRISKGLGLISEIMNILENFTLGEHYFSTALLLGESLKLRNLVWLDKKRDKRIRKPRCTSTKKNIEHQNISPNRKFISRAWVFKYRNSNQSKTNQLLTLFGN